MAVRPAVVAVSVRAPAAQARERLGDVVGWVG